MLRKLYKRGANPRYRAEKGPDPFALNGLLERGPPVSLKRNASVNMEISSKLCLRNKLDISFWDILLKKMFRKRPAPDQRKLNEKQTDEETSILFVLEYSRTKNPCKKDAPLC